MVVHVAADVSKLKCTSDHSLGGVSIPISKKARKSAILGYLKVYNPMSIRSIIAHA